MEKFLSLMGWGVENDGLSVTYEFITKELPNPKDEYWDSYHSTKLLLKKFLKITKPSKNPKEFYC